MDFSRHVLFLNVRSADRKLAGAQDVNERVCSDVLALGRHLLVTPPVVRERDAPRTPDEHTAALVRVSIAAYLLKCSFYLHFSKCQCC